MREDSIKKILDNKSALRCRLFPMGFYASTKRYSVSEYPFYGDWNLFTLDNMVFSVHPRQHFYSHTDDGMSIALVGHAYDPIHMMANEDEILSALANADEKSFFEEICSLTGVYTLIWKKDDVWRILGDASGIQTTFYAVTGEAISISSHANLIGDMLGLEMDAYIKHLSSYKFFKLLGNSLPGDLTQFSQVKRVVPNHYVEFSGKVRVQRYHTPEIKKISYEQVVNEVSNLLHSNLILIAEKWQRPAISMSGGCDSKTTLACASGLYEKFSYFSFISSDEEKVDAEAANRICHAVLPVGGGYCEHRIYEIPNDDSVFDDIEEQREILWYNCGSMRRNNLNDVRKRCYFAGVDDFDIEVKSWASEIGRAYYSKRFNNRKKFPEKPTPRACTTMYKFFFHDRKLVRQTDAVFKEYLEKYSLNSQTIPWQEQFFWEFRVASWNGIVITGEHRYSYDITIPYNNCTLLELLLSVPIEDRISDKLYWDIRKKMNPKVDDVGVHVQNVKHTTNRAKAENVYYILHSKIPF